MAKRINGKRVLGCAALVLALVLCFAFTAFAEAASCESATATGLYRHPETGVIEDSGGESSEALGQSMVDSVVTPQALVETTRDGRMYLSLRFALMSNISEVNISVQQPGDTAWETVPFESTDKQADTEDFRLPIPGKDAIVRAECMVDAMGRKVIFYVTLGDFVPGNAGGFAPLDADAKPFRDNAGSSAPAGGNPVGLVTGGSAPAAKPDAAVPETAAPAGTRTVMLGANVWIMFFVLVFCAQLLACLAFWGIKTLVERGMGSRGRHEEAEESLLPEDEEDFSEDFLENGWTEDDNENP